LGFNRNVPWVWWGAIENEWGKVTLEEAMITLIGCSGKNPFSCFCVSSVSVNQSKWTNNSVDVKTNYKESKQLTHLDITTQYINNHLNYVKTQSVRVF